MAIVLLLFILLIVILVVIFALQNAAVVPISYLFWNSEGSLALILLLALVIGVFIGLLVAAPSFIKSRRRISNQEKEIDELQGEVQEQATRLEMIEQQLTADQEELEVTSEEDVETGEPAAEVSVFEESAEEELTAEPEMDTAEVEVAESQDQGETTPPSETIPEVGDAERASGEEDN